MNPCILAIAPARCIQTSHIHGTYCRVSPGLWPPWGHALVVVVSLAISNKGDMSHTFSPPLLGAVLLVNLKPKNFNVKTHTAILSCLAMLLKTGGTFACSYFFPQQFGVRDCQLRERVLFFWWLVFIKDSVLRTYVTPGPVSLVQGFLIHPCLALHCS